MKTILILGGCGFIGSNLAAYFVDRGHKVVIVDGLLARTGADIRNIDAIRSKIDFHSKRIEEVDQLSQISEQADLIIDCMAWTSHHAALKDPFYDVELNLLSHLKLLKYHKVLHGKTIIYLGSRGQYGVVPTGIINEKAEMKPNDVQGINKLAAEHFYRLYAELYGLQVISLRIPNCFGENQPVKNEIGLVGMFIKDALDDKEISIYNLERYRNFLYVKDLCSIVEKLPEIASGGFQAFTVAGQYLSINELAKTIKNSCGSGKIILIPAESGNIDIGNSEIDDSKIRQLIPYTNTELTVALRNTIQYFKNRIL